MFKSKIASRKTFISVVEDRPSVCRAFLSSRVFASRVCLARLILLGIMQIQIKLINLKSSIGHHFALYSYSHHLQYPIKSIQESRNQIPLEGSAGFNIRSSCGAKHLIPVTRVEPSSR